MNFIENLNVISHCSVFSNSMKITMILLVFIALGSGLSVSKHIDDIYDTKRSFSSFYGSHDLASTGGFGKKEFVEWQRFKGIIPYFY